MVVDLVPTACHGVQTVAPVKPPTQSRKVMPKGKAVPHPTMQLHACKVTWIMTLMPEVAEVEAPHPPIAGPSRASCGPLFEEAVRSGDEQVRMGASGKCFLGLPL